MTVKGVFEFVQNAAHALLPLAGVATTGAAVIAVFANKFGVPQDLTLGAIAAVGSSATVVSKWIDSKSFTNLQAEAIRADADVRLAIGDLKKGDVIDAAKSVVSIGVAPPAPPAA